MLLDPVWDMETASDGFVQVLDAVLAKCGYTAECEPIRGGDVDQ